MIKGEGKLDKSNSRKVKVNLWITREQDAFLTEMKEKTGLDKSEHHRRAIDLYREYMESLKKSPMKRRSTDALIPNGKDDQIEKD